MAVNNHLVLVGRPGLESGLDIGPTPCPPGRGQMAWSQLSDAVPTQSRPVAMDRGRFAAHPTVGRRPRDGFRPSGGHSSDNSRVLAGPPGAFWEPEYYSETLSRRRTLDLPAALDRLSGARQFRSGPPDRLSLAQSNSGTISLLDLPVPTAARRSIQVELPLTMPPAASEGDRPLRHWLER